MNSCKIIYFLFVLVYCFLYYTNNTWIAAVDFKWPHFIFLLTCLLLLERYNLVPDALWCPPFYVLYKIVAAAVLANAALLTIFLQVEDLLTWVIFSFAELLKKIGITMFDEHLKNERTPFIAQMLLTTYLLLWVIVSSGVLPQKQEASSSSSSTNLRPSPSRRRRKSKVRC